jgi:branched-subunit amino acid transport protein AzlD
MEGAAMSAATLTLLVLATGTYALKAAGPLLLGGDRQLPASVERLALLLPAPLLAALVVTSTVVTDRAWVVDARLVGMAVAAIALWRRQPFVVVVIAAAAGTGLTRALS